MKSFDLLVTEFVTDEDTLLDEPCFINLVDHSSKSTLVYRVVVKSVQLKNFISYYSKRFKKYPSLSVLERNEFCFTASLCCPSLF